jgi:hypothetical protein
MSRRPISRSSDLRRLEADGFTISVVGGHLVVRDVPFVDHEGVVHHDGALVMPLTLAGDIASPPGDHMASFVGGVPCDAQGRQLNTLVNATLSPGQDLGNGLIATATLSMKPVTGGGNYPDFYEKVAKYVAAIAPHATGLDPSATAKRHRPIPVDDSDDSPFHYVDTATSRAGIGAANAKLRDETVAIVGLGGTGQYLLDLISKAEVEAIHIFDEDEFLTHNAFRAPGSASIDELESRPLKVDLFGGIYSRTHRRITAHPYRVDEQNAGELRAMTFVFIAIDDGPAKAPIIAELLDAGIPFIDVGMGVELIDGHLTGIVRTTLVTPEQHDHVYDRISIAAPSDDAIYRSNIQIVELNARNATDAVIRWKKYRGVYADLVNEHSSAFSIATNIVINNDTT